MRENVYITLIDAAAISGCSTSHLRMCLSNIRRRLAEHQAQCDRSPAVDKIPDRLHLWSALSHIFTQPSASRGVFKREDGWQGAQSRGVLTAWSAIDLEQIKQEVPCA